MNGNIKIFATLFMAAILAISINLPVEAQSTNYQQVNVPFSLDGESPGENIPLGSTIIHNGDITQVYGPDNSLFLQAQDSNTGIISTPFGAKKATYVYNIPSGSHIAENGDATQVYSNGVVILTVEDNNGIESANPANQITQSNSNGWIEQTKDWSVSNLDFSTGLWTVPSSPPNPSPSVVDYLFNAIQNNPGQNIILQPVLEWNQFGTHIWTGQSWYASNGNYYASSKINVAVGDGISGVMQYVGGLNGWYIIFQDNRTGQQTSITTSVLGTSNLAVFCTLESGLASKLSDLPGSTLFTNMTFQYQNNNINIPWVAQINSPPGISGLYIVIYSSASVLLGVP